VDVQGIEDFNRQVRRLRQDIFRALPEGAKAGADIVRDNASARARRKSGDMADGIISQVTWDKNAPIAFAAACLDPAKNDTFVKYSANGKRYYYPAAVEYGHGKVPAYPFMRPAMTKNRAKIKKEIASRFKAVIDEMR